MFLTQAGYVNKVLSKFVINKFKLVSRPLAAHFKLSKLQEPTVNIDIEYMKKIPYINVICIIIYAMICSSRFIRNLSKEH